MRIKRSVIGSLWKRRCPKCRTVLVRDPVQVNEMRIYCPKCHMKIITGVQRKMEVGEKLS